MHIASMSHIAVAERFSRHKEPRLKLLLCVSHSGSLLQEPTCKTYNTTSCNTNTYVLNCSLSNTQTLKLLFQQDIGEML